LVSGFARPPSEGADPGADRSLSFGNPGNAKPAGEGISELRIDYGPGYRVYFVRRGETVIVLRAGGDKRTQAQDIDLTPRLARTL